MQHKELADISCISVLATSTKKKTETLKLGMQKWRARRKKCPYSELFWSSFSRIRTEYGEIRSISPYSVRMRENVDKNNSECRHFSRSGASVNFSFRVDGNVSFHCSPKLSFSHTMFTFAILKTSQTVNILSNVKYETAVLQITW